MTKEQLIDGLLELNFQLRSCEESLANIINAVDANINLEKITDDTMLKNPPITSVEGIDMIAQRLNIIEDMIKCLVVDQSLNVANALVQYKRILQEDK